MMPLTCPGCGQDYWSSECRCTPMAKEIPNGGWVNDNSPLPELLPSPPPSDVGSEEQVERNEVFRAVMDFCSDLDAAPSFNSAALLRFHTLLDMVDACDRPRLMRHLVEAVADKLASQDRGTS